MTTIKAYDLSAHIAEIYDQIETQTDDVDLLYVLLEEERPLRILEPFCGTGRLAIPLAEWGHEVVGLDKAAPMLARAQGKIDRLPPQTAARLTLHEADVLRQPWPTGFDLVLLGGNCLYELSSAADQEHCFRQAREALRPGGYLYLDNNHMEGRLAESWRHTDIEGSAFPSGLCADGTRLAGSSRTIWFDAARRLCRFQRSVTITHPDGKSSVKSWEEQKHPPSTAEMRRWLEENGFNIIHLWGERDRTPYSEQSSRAIFWAQAGF